MSIHTRARRLLAAALLALACAIPGAARAQNATFPAEIETTVVYTLSSTEDVGTPNVPMCRSREWQANLRLRLRRVKTDPFGTEYEAVSGSWDAKGTCQGEMTWQQDDRTCTWTTTGTIHGSGAFAPGGASSASLILGRDGNYQIVFDLNGARMDRSWRSPCRSDGNASSETGMTGSVQEVPFTLAGGRLSLAPSGNRRSTNENVDGVYLHRWAVGGAIEEDVRVAIDGPACGCMEAGQAQGAPLRFTARTTSEGGTWTRFIVTPAGEAPREISNTAGDAPVLEIAGTPQTGQVALRVTYTKDGQEYSAERTVDFCVMDSVGFGGSNGDFTFDDSPEGRLEVEATGRVWFNGELASEDIHWTLDRMGDGTRLSPGDGTGPIVRLAYEGLPEMNGAFGTRSVEARFRRGDCECARKKEFRTFFRALAANHPHANDREGSPYRGMPNWMYYWSQTSAMHGPIAGLRYAEGMDDGQGNAVGARYDEEDDVVLMSDAVFLSPCSTRMDRATRVSTGVQARGIDCFGETTKHEHQHRLDWRAWWPEGQVSLRKDRDLDGVPAEVEERTAGCDPANAYSCADRPFPALVTDREVNAYWVGWSWAIGSADKEDWSCRGKQWKGGSCT